MRKLLLALLTVVLFVFVLQSAATAQINININFGTPTYNDYYNDMSRYYHVPPGQLKKYRNRGFPGEQLPVALYMASRARVSPSVIVDLRLGGMNWMEISMRYGIPPSAYYVPVGRTPGPPYGHAYGYYNKHPRKKWKWRYMRFSDNDFVNLVNLRFISDNHGYSPAQVIKMRSDGKDFVKINSHAKKNKSSGNWNNGNQGNSGNKGNSGKSKNKGNKGSGKGKGKNK